MARNETDLNLTVSSKTIVKYTTSISFSYIFIQDLALYTFFFSVFSGQLAQF